MFQILKYEKTNTFQIKEKKTKINRRINVK